MQSGANSKPPPWQADGNDGEAISFGAWLRREREIREIPLNEIADVTKISIRYLEALEQDRFDVLPAPVFAKGFLREYARYVGLDPDDVINSYLSTQQEGENAEAEEEAPTPKGSGSSAVLMGGGIVALLAVVAALIFYSERFRGEDEQPPPAIAAPAIVPPAAEEPAAEAQEPAAPVVTEPTVPLVVNLDFTEDCWVEAVVDGQRRLSELHVQGESLRIEAQREVSLTLGNPSGVRIESNGEPFDPGVRGDRVARDIVITVDPEAEGESGPEPLEATGGA